MIRPLTEHDCSVKSASRAWAADATKGAREASKLSAEDFGDKSGVSESRQFAYERQDEGKREEPRVQLDKIARWPLVSLLALCRGLLGNHAVIVETAATATTLGDAGRVLTKESSEAVLGSLVAAHTPETLANLEREATELATHAMGVALAARAERERLLSLSTPRAPRLVGAK